MAPIRKPMAKDHWQCKLCTRNGKPTFNFGDKLKCFGCNIHKDKCYGGRAPPKGGGGGGQGQSNQRQPPTTGQRQQRQEKALEKKAKRDAKVQKELEELRSQVKTLEEQKGKASPDGGEEESGMEVDEVPEATLEQLHKIRQCYIKECKLQATDPMVLEVDKKIEDKKATRQAAKEGHVQLAEAGRAIKGCNSRLEKSTKKGEGLQKELDGIQQKLDQWNLDHKGLQEELEKLEEAKKKLLATLHLKEQSEEPAPGKPTNQLGSAIQGTLQFAEALGKEELDKITSSTSSLQEALAKLGQKAKEAEEQAGREALANQEAVRKAKEEEAEKKAAEERAKAAADAAATEEAKETAATERPQVANAAAVGGNAGGSHRSAPAAIDLTADDIIESMGDDHGLEEGQQRAIAEGILKTMAKRKTRSGPY